MLKSLSLMSSISENQPAETISLMSVTKEELPSKSELMLFSFYLCPDHWISKGKPSNTTIKKMHISRLLNNILLYYNKIPFNSYILAM